MVFIGKIWKQAKNPSWWQVAPLHSSELTLSWILNSSKFKHIILSMQWNIALFALVLLPPINSSNCRDGKGSQSDNGLTIMHRKTSKTCASLSKLAQPKGPRYQISLKWCNSCQLWLRAAVPYSLHQYFLMEGAAYEICLDSYVLQTRSLFPYLPRSS